MYFLLILVQPFGFCTVGPHYTDKEADAQNIWYHLYTEPVSTVIKTPKLCDFSKSHDLNHYTSLLNHF